MVFRGPNTPETLCADLVPPEERRGELIGIKRCSRKARPLLVIVKTVTFVRRFPLKGNISPIDRDSIRKKEISVSQNHPLHFGLKQLLNQERSPFTYINFIKIANIHFNRFPPRTIPFQQRKLEKQPD